MLIRFWITFDLSNLEVKDSQRWWSRGCGVTAHDYADAVSLLQDRVFRDDLIPLITAVVENVDVSSLDAGHILPNIGVASERGVWYPNISGC